MKIRRQATGNNSVTAYEVLRPVMAPDPDRTVTCGIDYLLLPPHAELVHDAFGRVIADLR